MAAFLKSAITVYICGASPSAAERTQTEKSKIIYVHTVLSLFHTLSQCRWPRRAMGKKRTVLISFLLERQWTSVWLQGSVRCLCWECNKITEFTYSWTTRKNDTVFFFH